MIDINLNCDIYANYNKNKYIIIYITLYQIFSYT